MTGFNTFIVYCQRAVTLLLLTTTPLQAATLSLQAKVRAATTPSINEVTSLSFGSLVTPDAATCVLDSSGTLSGQCEQITRFATLGELHVSGLNANQVYQLSVQGSETALIRFTPGASFRSNAVVISQKEEGSLMQIQVADNDETGTLLVYGDLAIKDRLVPGQTYQFNYTVQIYFQ